MDVKTLSEVYNNALSIRKTKVESYPPIEIIEKYIYSSRHLDIKGGIVNFLGSPSELSYIDLDVYEYLKEKYRVSYREFVDYLLSKNYSKAHIDKAITKSPIVYVNKSRGLQHHQYSLVPGKAKPIITNSDSRYHNYLSRLRKIEEFGTDTFVATKARNEQSTLSSWLFEDKAECDCAICGESYHVKALVTAHKKKRSIPNDAERLNPYIVMPLCIFGCDYLYESKIIYVLDGIIKINPTILIGKAESRRAKELSGRRLNANWLQGPKEFFLLPDIE